MTIIIKCETFESKDFARLIEYKPFLQPLLKAKAIVMFNNTALDVAIGLTFIFVLYSLLALTINEFLATIFAYRSRMLERALEQMLDGKNYGYHWWDKVANFFLWIYYLFKEKSSSSDQQNEELKSLDAFLSKTDLSNPEVASNGKTRFYYRRVKVNEKSLLFTANITDHPLYKRKAEKSVFFKKPAYLSADSFSDMLIDILGKNRTAGSPILLKDITAFVNNEINNNPDLKKVLNLYIEQANGDLQRFKFLLENWFDDTMDRVSGWYKKQSYRRSIFIGFLIAMTFNVSTIDIVKKLSKDKDAREAMVKNASEYLKKHLDDTSFRQSPQVNDSASLEDVKKKIKEIDNFYKTEVAQNDSILGLGWRDFEVKEKTRKYDSLLALGKDPRKPLFMTKFGKPFYKPVYVLGKTFGSLNSLIGFLITALAISLGAPFWFDLLNRFVNLRVSGTKPESTKEQNVSSKTASLNQLPNPKAFG